MKPGMLLKSFTVKCGVCFIIETYNGGAFIDGRWRCYRDGAMWSLRNIHGWSTRYGIWLCADCAEDYDDSDSFRHDKVKRRVEILLEEKTE